MHCDEESYVGCSGQSRQMGLKVKIKEKVEEYVWNLWRI